MVRTGDRVVVSGGKSSAKKGKGGGGGTTRSSQTTSTGSSTSSNASSSGGGNPICPRETPAWQKPITTFFQKKSSDKPEENNEPSKSTEFEVITQNNQNLPTSDKMAVEDNIDEKETEQQDPIEKALEKLQDEEEVVKEDTLVPGVESNEMKSVEDSSENDLNSGPPVKKVKFQIEDTKENDTEGSNNVSSCTTPTSDKKRKAKHINVLTPRHKKIEK